MDEFNSADAADPGDEADSVAIDDDQEAFDNRLLAREFEQTPDDTPEDAETVAFWESKQRELVLSVVDYNLESLGGLVRSKTIDLSPRYQRRHRWDNARRSALIESFLINVPIPPIFLNEDKTGRYSVIDGKQRLSAVTGFLDDGFALEGLKVFGRLNGAIFSKLPGDLREALKTRATLRATIILKQSDPDVKTIVFQRLNRGGMVLNAQEVRNAAFPGPFNDLIISLSELPAMRQVLRITKPATSQLWRQMRDVELVLRYFTFRDDWDSFAHGLSLKLDEFMENHQYAKPRQLKMMREDFVAQLDAIKLAFGDFAFRRFDTKRGKWRKQIVAAVYDAEMFAIRPLRERILASGQALPEESLKELFSDAGFRAAIDAGTNSVATFRSRIELMSAMLDAEYPEG